MDGFNLIADNLIADIFENINRLKLSILSPSHQWPKFNCYSNSMYHCDTIESNVLHQFASYLEKFPCKIILFSLQKTCRLKIDFEIGISLLCFQRRVSLHSTVTLDILTVRHKTRTMYLSNLSTIWMVFSLENKSKAGIWYKA